MNKFLPNDERWKEKNAVRVSSAGPRCSTTLDLSSHYCCSGLKAFFRTRCGFAYLLRTCLVTGVIFVVAFSDRVVRLSPDTFIRIVRE